MTLEDLGRLQSAMEEQESVEKRAKWHIWTVRNISMQPEEIQCYNLKTLGLTDKQNLVQGCTRELNRELCTELSTLYTELHGPC